MSTLFKIKSVYKHEFLANITFFSKINIDIHTADARFFIVHSSNGFYKIIFFFIAKKL